MDTINREYIEEYIQSLISLKSDELKIFRKECENRKLPIIRKEVAQYIKLVIEQLNAKNIIEIGTNVGFSSIFMIKCSKYVKNITTIERREDFYNEAIENIKKFKLENNIKVCYGDASDILDTIEGEFDLAFIDAAKSSYKIFFDKCFKLLRPGGIILSDNILYQGMVACDELVPRRKKTSVRHLRNYLEYISTDERFVTSILPLADGLAITMKK